MCAGLKDFESERAELGSCVKLKKMGSSSEDILESLMNDGTIDSLRLIIINQLRVNEELKNTTIKMWNRNPVLEKASKSVWELILNSDGLGKDISETVEDREPTLFPLPIVENQPCKETEKGKEQGKEKEHENEKDNSNSTSKKRSYNEMNE
ncbi:hypothetical protein Ddye_027084 [Dipteronia dyeriana]|uniref:Uncharacterized protein n=1 Tax=Dipteronia dyeriana TaxID=168575 RepID=A0AAD9TPC3_9ROSI|nr:hypothetical protein Ddye_027084 [Dipteronia dyeriana]